MIPINVPHEEDVLLAREFDCLQIPWKPWDTFNSLVAARRALRGPCFVEVVILACCNI
jgi:hypothetical protein